MKGQKRPGILNNIGLRIGAFIAAVIIWFLVTDINDPVTKVQFDNISVKLLNTSTITDAGQVYTVLDGTDTIPVVTVMASRSIIDSLDKDNIVATADASDITSLGTVDITLTTNKYSGKIESIKGSIDTVRLSVEKKKTTQLALRYTTSGTPADGYVLGDVTIDQNQVRVSGPESIVSKIAKAEANVDVSGAAATVTTNVDVKLYDSDGKAIDATSLTMNISTVKVSAVILPTKNVPIQVSIGGTPAEGYALNGKVTVTPATVTIAGRSSVLNSIESIVISSDSIDVTGAAETRIWTIDITGYLPENVTISDDSFDGNISIVAEIEQIEKETLDFDSDSIAVTNVPDGYDAAITSVSDGLGNTGSDGSAVKLSVDIVGLKASLDTVSASNIAPTLDVASIIGDVDTTKDISGSYNGEVALTLPDKVTADNTVRAVITLTAKKSDTDTTE